MMKRIAGILAITVIGFQALAGTAFAVTTTSGLGDAYNRDVTDDADTDNGQCYSEETAYIALDESGKAFYCDTYSGDDSSYLSEIKYPIEVVAGTDIVIDLADYDDDNLSNWKGIDVELQAGGRIVFDGYNVDDKGASLAVTDTTIKGLGLDNFAILNAETVAFYGTDFNDTFDASAVTVDMGPEFYFGWNAGASEQSLFGSAGNDVIKGGTGDDALDGGDGNDVVYGNAGDDFINCEGSNDTDQCWGGVGDDEFDVRANGGPSTKVTVAPGDGADYFDFTSGSGGNVTMYYGDTTNGQSVTLADIHGADACEASDFGEDSAEGSCGAIGAIVGSPKADVFDASDNTGDMKISGGVGNDVIVGGSGDNTLSGGDGADKLFGDGTLLGGNGNDKLVGGGALYGNGGDDKIFGGDSSDDIGGGTGADLAYGEEGADTVAGGKGNDRLSGGAGDDEVNGGAGKDQLHGDTGDDMLKGNGGADRAWGDSDSLADGGDGDMCDAEITAGCEWVLSVGPAGPYWVKLA